jgi:hypothetical protein
VLYISHIGLSVDTPWPCLSVPGHRILRRHNWKPTIAHASGRHAEPKSSTVHRDVNTSLPESMHC